MEEIREYWVEEIGKKFYLFSRVDAPSFTKTILGFCKAFPSNVKTRRIYKIYKANYSLGMKLFETYLDKHPHDITPRINNGKDI